MPFKQRFERRVNRNMRETLQAGPAPRQSEDDNLDLKKAFRATQPEDDDADDESMDEEKHEKMDRPPRFSTLFGSPPPPPPAPVQYIERPAKRRSGVYMPMSLFILFMVIVFFESTILFAYTILGLYNNAPQHLFGFGGAPSCQTSTQPLVNISPNFMLPAAPQGLAGNPWLGGSNVGVGPDVTTPVVTTTSSTTSTSTSSTTSSTTSSSSAISTSTSTTSSTSVSSTTSSSTSTITSSAQTTSASVVEVTQWTNPVATVTSVVLGS